MTFDLPAGGTTFYAPFVAALVKPGLDILNSLTPEKANAWHMASCVSGEAGELFDACLIHDRENAIEELGDIEFYLQGLRTELDISFAEVVPGCFTGEQDHMGLPGRAGDVFDAVKKWVIYNKPLARADIIAAMRTLEEVLIGIREAFGVSRNDILQGNVSKLGVRYASLGYSDAAAQARADKTVH